MRLTISLVLLASTAFAGDAVQFCVGSRYGSVTACAPTFAELPSDTDGQLFATDAVGNYAEWGLFCSWRGVRVAGAEMDVISCDEAKRRLDDAANSLTRVGLVAAAEWPRILAVALHQVLLYATRVLEVPHGEPFVEGVYEPAALSIHLTSSLEAAPHELFHAVLKARGTSLDHDAFNARVDWLTRSFRAKYRGRPL